MMVQMIDRRYSFLQAIGYLSVQIQDIKFPTVLINCVIPAMCLSKGEYYYVNPNSHLTLFSLCSRNCSSNVSITWKIYQGLMTETVQWTSFNSTRSSSLFIGKDLFDQLKISLELLLFRSEYQELNSASRLL